MCPPAQAPLGVPTPGLTDRSSHDAPRRHRTLSALCVLGLGISSWTIAGTPAADATTSARAHAQVPTHHQVHHQVQHRVGTSPRKALATVRVKQPRAVTKAARYVILNGTTRGSYRKQLTVQRKVNGTWRKVRTLPASRAWTVTVKLAKIPSTFRVVARTTRGAVASNKVTVTLAKTTAAIQLSLPLDQHDAKRATILRATNAFRARYGLPALRPLTVIDKIATKWSQHQAATRTMAHNPSYWSGYPSGWRAVAENVAYGFPVNDVVRMWINSPPHRANLLGDYTHIGIGYATDVNGVAYYTQDFAKY